MNALKQSTNTTRHSTNTTRHSAISDLNEHTQTKYKYHKT